MDKIKPLITNKVSEYKLKTDENCKSPKKKRQVRAKISKTQLNKKHQVMQECDVEEIDDLLQVLKE